MRTLLDFSGIGGGIVYINCSDKELVEIIPKIQDSVDIENKIVNISPSFQIIFGNFFF
jgi:hypothetical protein